MSTKTIASLSLILGLLFSLTFCTQPSEAASTNYYGSTATAVANDIGCKNHRLKSSDSYYKMTRLVCDLKGKRVNVMVFDDNLHQFYWKIDAQAGLPASFYWAQGQGVTIVARDGNRSAARLGAAVVQGRVHHG